MSESFVIKWDTGTLYLCRVPDQGMWEGDAAAIASVDLERPTRTARMRLHAIQQGLNNALGKLVTEIEAERPVWFFLPPEWVFRFNVQRPEFDSPEQQREHLIWETRQRLRGDKSQYQVMIHESDDSDIAEICVVRKEILENITNACEAAGLELSGIKVEPYVLEPYSFNAVEDLRNSEVIEPGIISFPTIERRSFLPFVGVAVVLIVLVFASAYLYNNYIAGKKSSTAGFADISSTTAEIATQTEDSSVVIPTPSDGGDLTEKIGVSSGTNIDNKAVQSPVPTAAVAAPISSLTPLGLMNQLIPGGGRIEQATVSAGELRVEVTGLTNTDQWLNSLRKQPALKNLQIAGRYKNERAESAVFVLQNPGVNDETSAASSQEWRKRAATIGLKASGRTAKGDYNQAIGFIEQLWGDMSGFSKLYLLRDHNSCILTMQ